MDFIEKIQLLAQKIAKEKDHIQTEEATKNAFVLPFINSLGYDIFSPLEVIPEYTADVGIKKGEKVDYAVLKDGRPIMLFECKTCGCDLNNVHMSQLYRYFSVTDARIGVLTNGIVYRFFSDLEKPNQMDNEVERF
jgi:predicted type IV restriction endonuclease